MATESLVRELIDSGQQLIDALRDQGIDVAAAFWLKPSYEEAWFLYIATPLVDDNGLAAAYGNVYRVLRSLPNWWVLESDIKLIGVENPIARDVLAWHQSYPGRVPTRYGGRLLGRVLIDDAYLYPVSPAA